MEEKGSTSNPMGRIVYLCDFAKILMPDIPASVAIQRFRRMVETNEPLLRDLRKTFYKKGKHKLTRIQVRIISHHMKIPY